MRTAPAPVLRTRRALSVGASSALGAVLAHGLAGGTTPPLWILLLAVATGSAVAAPLTRVRLDASALGAAALLTQGAFHAAFMVHESGTATQAASHGAPMLVAHAVAALGTVLLACSAEQAWWRLAQRLLLRALPTMPATTPAPEAITLVVDEVAIPEARGHHSPRRTRGPPHGARILALA